MKEKLNCILLIDDDEPTNYYNTLVIEEAGCAEKIVVMQTAPEALDYLKTEVNGSHPRPDLIFLDINMPAMNGWDFLVEYARLDGTQKGEIIIVMLTTSLNPNERDRAKDFTMVKDYKSKPLSLEGLGEILNTHFPGRFS